VIEQMQSDAMFAGIVDFALQKSTEDESIQRNAAGIITIPDLIAAARRDDAGWKLMLAVEFASWKRDAEQLEQIVATFQRESEESPTLLDRIYRQYNYLFLDEAAQAARRRREMESSPTYWLAFENERDTFQALLTALTQQCVMPALRTALNERLDQDITNTRLEESDAAGLYQLLPVGFELQSDGRKRLEHLLYTLTAGSIGIAGPRGSGKTTLLASFCDQPAYSTPGLRMMVTAPVRYEARDYLLYLLTSICKTMLDGLGSAHAATPPPQFNEWPAAHVRWLVLRGAGATLGLAGLVAGALWMIGAGLPIGPDLKNALATYVTVFSSFLAFTIIRQVTLEPLQLVVYLKRPQNVSLFDRLQLSFWLGRQVSGWLAVALVLLPVYRALPPYNVVAACLGGTLAIMLTYSFGRRGHLDGWNPRAADEDYVRREYGDRRLAAPLTTELQEILTRASYQLARSTTRAERVGASVNLGVGLSVDSTVGSSETAATTAWTRPELVSAIRGVLTSITTRHGSVTIGIDELDKIETPEHASQFIDDVKGIFGVSGCHFLISVSEDALTQFERRGMPFRTSFDSAFDEIVTLKYFTLEESKRLLRSRILVVPLRFIALCHALSGGLPRDLLRISRHLYELPLPVELHEAASRLVSEELGRKTALMAASMQDSTLHPWSTLFAVWTDRARLDADSPSHLLATAAELSQLADRAVTSSTSLSDEDWKALRTCTEMATFIYFCATVLEVCSNSPQIRGHRPETVAELLADLARARQGFSSHTGLVWARIDALRIAADWPSLGSPHWR